MRPLQRIVWAEGMLMSPQHFQQQDLYHEALLDERLGASVPYAWGACELELDERALESGQVALRSFVGVLPRGTALRFRAGDPEAPPARALENHLPAHRELLDVHLAVPLERVGSVSYARSEAERSRARYVLEARGVLDAVSPSEEESVDFARRNTMLLFGEEARDDCESIKVGEIVRDRAGKFAFSGAYVVPALRIVASPFIVDGLRRILAASVAKRRAVADELRHRDKSSIEFAADEVTRYLALSALSGTIPVLKHLLDAADVASPYRTYLVLVQFAGQLSAFSTDDDPAALPSYSHIEPRTTFEPLFAKLLSLLQLAVASRVVTVPLESRVDGMHIGRLQPPELLKQGVRFVLGVQASVAEHTAHELIPRVAKIASWTEIPRYMNAAVSTVPLAASIRPPREIPIRPGKLYFMVSTENPFWRAVMSERTLAVHLPPPFDPKSTVVELFAILPA